jgi:FkbM family methyltransferase
MTSFLDYSKLILAHGMSVTRKALLGDHVEAVLTRGDSGLFLVDVDDMAVGRRLARDGEYGVAEVKRLLSVVTEQSTVLIVGAHVGTLAIPASKRCRSLIAVEANPRTFQLLCKNLLLNECTNVRALNVAASDKNEKIRFVLSKTNSGGAKRMPKVERYEYLYDSPEVVSIEAYPLDEVLRDSQIDTILMDIEGSEYFALGGMQAILSRASVLFMEFIPHHLRNVSGVSVNQLVELIRPHFSTLSIPDRGITVSKDRFNEVLQAIYDRDQREEGVIFTK